MRGNFVSPFLHQTMEKEKETGNEVADIFYDGFIAFLKTFEVSLKSSEEKWQQNLR